MSDENQTPAQAAQLTAARLLELAERIDLSGTLDPSDRRLISAALTVLARWIGAGR